MVEVTNLTNNPVDEEFLKKVAEKVLKGENAKGKELSIVLVGPEKIRNLNRKYRHKNKITDVLAFGKTDEFLSFPEEKLELGEIVICLQKVKENAKRFNSTFKKELVQVLIHGILHLLEYDHKKGGLGAKKMEKKQQHYLSKY